MANDNDKESDPRTLQEQAILKRVAAMLNKHLRRGAE